MLLAMNARLLLLTLCTLPFQLLAQADELAAVNSTFSGSVVFKIDKKQQLVMDFFDAGGRFRQDIATVEELDPDAISFSPEENAVVLKCRADKEKCMTKEIFKLDVVRLSSRSTLPRPGSDVAGEAAIAQLKALLLASENALMAFPGETTTRRSRKSDR